MKVLECSTEKDWLHERSKRLTASEMSSLFGVNPFKSELALWAEKTGKVEPKFLDSEPVQWGKEFQGAIGRRFASKTQRTVIEANPFHLFIHPVFDWFGASLDFWEEDAEQGKGVLETKATDMLWEDGAPLNYQIQLQCQLAITLTPYGTLCAFNGLKKPPIWIDYKPHPEFIKRLISKAEEFWWRVTTKNPPAVGSDTSESTKEALAALYPTDVGTTVALPPEALTWTQELESLKAQKKSIEDQVTLRESLLKEALKDASFGQLTDGTRWSWRKQTRIDPPRTEARVTEFRVLRHLRGGK